MLLITQWYPSRLLKLSLDPRTEQVTGLAQFPLGDDTDLPHGLAASTRYPGRIWATLEGAHHLLLLDPAPHSLKAAPRVLRDIPIPDGGKGPHYVGEYGDLLWVSLKGSNQVLAIDHRHPERHWFFDARSQPIFVGRHPASGEFYASQDKASSLLRIPFPSGRTRQIAIPPERGATPVGVIAGLGALWVALLGTERGGTGTFGRIDEHGRITWYRLSSPMARSAGLLHIAFDPPASGRRPGLWLLGSSIISDRVLDLIVRVELDRSHRHIVSEEAVALPTQLSKAHRLLVTRRSVFATEMHTSALAQLAVPQGHR
ncbi:hypothetical protein QWM81_01940 [Streptomyces ficellus]|uniref:Uncharacterized protein n=1 Tax=Streptomyces ficellus TaxID=1977088 RepID=A0ABT7Z010_9ACTN|nr:hypothetical protein [Streptomyces ficellus]MDN3292824.1 hypothetical protein [Streptomyces ficellus]